MHDPYALPHLSVRPAPPAPSACGDVLADARLKARYDSLMESENPEFFKIQALAQELMARVMRCSPPFVWESEALKTMREAMQALSDKLYNLEYTANEQALHKLALELSNSQHSEFLEVRGIEFRNLIADCLTENANRILKRQDGDDANGKCKAMTDRLVELRGAGTEEGLRLVMPSSNPTSKENARFLFGSTVGNAVAHYYVDSQTLRAAETHDATTRRAGNRVIDMRTRLGKDELKEICAMDAAGFADWYDAVQLQKMSGYGLQPVRTENRGPQAMPGAGGSMPSSGPEVSGAGMGVYAGTYTGLNWGTDYFPVNLEEFKKFYTDKGGRLPAKPPGIAADYHMRSGFNSLNRFILATNVALRCATDSKFRDSMRRLKTNPGSELSERWHLSELKEALSPARYEYLSDLIQNPDDLTRAEWANRLDTTPLNHFVSGGGDLSLRPEDAEARNRMDQLRLAEIEAYLKRQGLVPPFPIASLQTMPLAQRRKFLPWLIDQMVAAKDPLVQEALAPLIKLIDDQGKAPRDLMRAHGIGEALSDHTLEGVLADAQREHASRAQNPTANLDPIHQIAEELGGNLSADAMSTLRGLRPDMLTLLQSLWNQMKSNQRSRRIFKLMLMNPQPDRILATAQTYLPDLYRALVHPGRELANEDKIVQLLIEQAKNPDPARAQEIAILLESVAFSRAMQATEINRQNQSADAQTEILERALSGDQYREGIRLGVLREFRTKAAGKILEELAAKAAKDKGRPLTAEEVTAANFAADPAVQNVLKPIFYAETADRKRQEMLQAQPPVKADEIPARITQYMKEHGPEIEAEAKERVERYVNANPGRGPKDVANLEAALEQAIRDCSEKLESGAIGLSPEKLRAEAAAHEKEAGELEQQAAEKRKEDPNDEYAVEYLAEAKRLRQLAQVKRSGQVFPTTDRSEHNAVKDRRDAELQRERKRFSERVGAWSVRRVELETLRRDKIAEVEAIATIIREQQTMLEKAEETGTTFEARWGGVDAVTTHKQAIADLKIDLMAQTGMLRDLFVELEALTTWDSRNVKEDDPGVIAARAEMAKYVEARRAASPNKYNFDNYNRTPTEFKVGEPVPEAIVAAIRPIAEQRFEAMMAREEKGPEGLLTRLKLDPLNEGRKQVYLRDLTTRIANELFKDTLRRDKEKELHAATRVADSQTANEVLLSTNAAMTRYNELTNACVNYLNEQKRLPYDFANLAQREVIQRGLIANRALFDEARDLFKGMLRLGMNDYDLRDPANRNLYGEFIARAARELGVTPAQAREKFDPIRQKVLEGHRSRNAEFLAALAPLKAVGFEWDGSGLVYKKARLYEFNSLEKRRQLKEMMNKLASFGKYPGAGITPWEELLTSISQSYASVGYTGAFRLGGQRDEHDESALDASDSTAVIMRREGHRVSVPALPSENVAELLLNDIENAEKYFEFANVRDLQAEATYLVERLQGKKGVAGAPDEKGLIDQLVQMREGYRGQNNSLRLTMKSWVTDDQLGRDMKDMTEMIQREIKALKTFGYIGLDTGQVLDVPALLGASMDARMKYGTIKTDLQKLHNDIHADHLALGRFLVEETALTLGTMGLGHVAKVRHLDKLHWLVKSKDFLKHAAVTYAMVASNKPLSEAMTNAYFNDTPYEQIIPWSAFGQNARNQTATMIAAGGMSWGIGRMLPASWTGTFLGEGIKGGLGIFATGMAVNEFSGLVGEPSVAHDKAFWNSLKMVPLGMLGPSTMLISRSGWLATRPALAGAAEWLIQSQSGAGFAVAESMLSPEGYHNMHGTKLTGWQVYWDALANSAIMDGNSARSASQQAPLMYVKRQMLLHPERGLDGFKQEYRGLPTDPISRGINWAQSKLGTDPKKLTREGWVEGALYMMEPREVLELGHKAATSTDAQVRKGAREMVAEFAQGAGFSGHGVEGAQGAALLTSALDELARSRGPRVMTQRMEQNVAALRAIGRRQLVESMRDPSNPNRPRDTTELLRHPLFREVTGAFDADAIADIPVGMMTSRPAVVDGRPTHIFDSPLFSATARNVAQHYGLPTNDFVEFAATYRPRSTDTMTDVVNQFADRSADGIRSRIIDGRLQPSEARRFYGSDYTEALSNTSLREAERVAALARQGDANAKRVMDEFAATAGLSPDAFSRGLDAYRADVIRRGGQSAANDGFSTTRLGDPAALSELGYFSRTAGSAPRPAPRPRARR